FSPPIDSKAYNAVLNGTFADDFNNIVDAKLKNLSPEDRSLLKNALFSKEAQEALPPQLMESFKKVQQAAITRLGQTHGVSQTWVPDTELLGIAAVKMKTINFKLALEQINQGKEWADSGMKTLKKLNEQIKSGGGTPPPSQSYLMSYLNAVNLVLIKMKEMSYEIAMTDSNLAMTMNKIQNDDQIGNLKKQEKDLKEVMAKEKKAESMGPLKAIFTWILNLILVMFLGPLAFVVIAAMMAKSIIEAVKDGKDGFKAFMAFDVISEVTKSFEQIGKAIGGPFGNFLAKAMSVMAIVALAVVAPQALAADLLMGNGTIVKELCKALSIPKDVTEKLSMAVQIVAQVVAMVVMAVLTGGATIAISIAQITKTIAQIALTIVKTVISLATNLVKTVTQMLKVLVAKVVDFLVDIAKSVVDALKAVGANSSKLGKVQQALTKAEHFVKATQAELNHTINGVKSSKAEIYLQKIIDNSKNKISMLEKQSNAFNSQGIKDLKETRNVAQNTLDSLGDTATAVEKTSAQVALDSAETALKTATEAASKAMQAAATRSGNIMQLVTNTAQTVKDVADAVVSIHNNILQAQIIRMRAAIEAAKIMVEVFIKVMKEMVAKLMAMAKGAIGDAKETGDQIQKMFAEASSVIQNLCNARA
ncbi:MAG: hypothetical protein H0W50_11975, partial [Parachlamydiaceae bacterium]|nr:hypothetical protein [Parachlamydiaceae bacterium]